MRMSMTTAAVIVASILAGCRQDRMPTPAPTEVGKMPTPATQDPINPAFSEMIHNAAVGYFDYPRVDDKPHWAPAPCAPANEKSDEPRVRMSSAGPKSQHTEKLFYLYVRNFKSYLEASTGSAPVGQTLVKQAYTAEEITNAKGRDTDDRRTVERNGHKYTTGDPLALFIMMKLDEKTPNTDHGWIYGVADYQGNVKSAGAVEACASCHANAAHDRIFGPN